MLKRYDREGTRVRVTKDAFWQRKKGLKDSVALLQLTTVCTKQKRVFTRLPTSYLFIVCPALINSAIIRLRRVDRLR